MASLNHYIDNQQIFEHTDIVSFDQYSDSKNYHSFLYWCDAYKDYQAAQTFLGNGDRAVVQRLDLRSSDCT